MQTQFSKWYVIQWIGFWRKLTELWRATAMRELNTSRCLTGGLTVFNGNAEILTGRWFETEQDASSHTSIRADDLLRIRASGFSGDNERGNYCTREYLYSPADCTQLWRYRAVALPQPIEDGVTATQNFNWESHLLVSERRDHFARVLEEKFLCALWELTVWRCVLNHSQCPEQVKPIVYPVCFSFYLLQPWSCARKKWL